MKELDFQKKAVDVVRQAGGFGMKLSHKFLVGVPDLLLKLPDGPVMMLEAKWDRAPSPTRRIRPYTLEVTPKQAATLRAAEASGMLAGVTSFLSDKRRFGVKVIPISCFEGGTRFKFHCISEYRWGKSSEFNDELLTALRHFAVTGT